MIPRLADLREPPVVGRFYLVPAIDYTWNGKAGLWPVVGPLHDDREFFAFPHLHYHVDLRFLTAAQFKRAKDHGYWRALGAVHASDAERAAASQPLCRLDEPLPKGRPQLIRRRCRLATRTYAFPNKKPVAALNASFDDGSGAARAILLKDGRKLCPHRKVDLSTYTPDERGLVTCPLHGLKVRCAP